MPRSCLPPRPPRRRPVRSLAGYRARLMALVHRHPWLDGHVLQPAPGHLVLFEQLVLELEYHFPKDLATRLTYFHVRPSEKGSAAFIDYDDPSYQRKEVIRTLKEDFERATLRVCALCGATWERPAQRNEFPCDLHPYTHVTVFDVLRQRGRRTPAPTPATPAPAEDKDEEENVPTAAPSVSTPEVPSDARPRIRLFDPAALDRLAPKTATPRREREDERLRQIADRVRAGGGPDRPLAVLPEDSQELLDRFAAMFPNFAEFTEFLRDQAALAALGDGRLAWPPVLLAGSPGIGKTEVARWLADEMGTPCRVIDMATAQSNSPLSGSDAFWANTREGGVFEALAYGPTANPLIVLDELDKAGHGDRYNAINALYTLIEPRSAERFIDLSVRDLAIDARHVLWVATANRAGPIPAPIRSRFTVFDIPDPTPDERRQIAGTIYARFRCETRWGEVFDEAIPDDVLERLAGFEPRSIARVLKQAMGRAARDGRRTLQADDARAMPASGSAFGFLSGTARPSLLEWN